MRRLQLFATVIGVAALGCATAAVPEVKVATARRPAPPARTRAPSVELFFKGDQAWARRGDEEWQISDVTRAEMVFSPDGKRFAYVRQRAQASAGRVTPSAHVLVRNLAGDPVNDFAVYRPGSPDQLTWLDNRRIGYLAPSPEPPAAAAPALRKPTNVFVVHDADTGEVLAARAGAAFTWDPSHHHLAFVSGVPGRQVLVVDGKTVWPRAGATKLHGDPTWGPEGHGLAIVDEGQAGAPKLVVLVEFEDPAGDLTWPVPRDALAPGLKVFWATDSKVVIGESALQPKFAAGWERLQ